MNRTPSRALPVLAGLLSGIVLGAALVACGWRWLDSAAGASLQYGGAAALAMAVHRAAGPARRPVGPLLLALLSTFALRRWLDPWANLAALEWGSGPAGQLAALVMPFEGVLLGVAAALDRRPR